LNSVAAVIHKNKRNAAGNSETVVHPVPKIVWPIVKASWQLLKFIVHSRCLHTYLN